MGGVCGGGIERKVSGNSRNIVISIIERNLLSSNPDRSWPQNEVLLVL